MIITNSHLRTLLLKWSKNERIALARFAKSQKKNEKTGVRSHDEDFFVFRPAGSRLGL